MASIFRKGKSFAVAFRLKGRPRQYLYGITTKRLAERAKAKLQEREELSKIGLETVDSETEQLSAAEARSLGDHIADFQQSILDRGKGRRHAQQQASHVRRVTSLAGVRSVGQIALEPIQRAIKQLLSSDCGPRTCNAARQAVIQFERYLKRTGKIRQTVLGNLERFREEEDIRRKRRALTQEEVHWLLATTSKARDSVSRRCGISPDDRALLYAVGIGTGYRKSALLSLCAGSFFVAENIPRPFVRLAAKANKNRKNRDQFIPHDLAERLRGWLAGKDALAPVWQPLPHADLALRFRRDLERARRAWIAAAPTQVERARREQSTTLTYVHEDGHQNVYADFHSLRHTGITFAVRRAGLRVGQKWADHSSPVLTARYAEVDGDDLQKAIDGLPRLGAAREPEKTSVASPAAPAVSQGGSATGSAPPSKSGENRTNLDPGTTP